MKLSWFGKFILAVVLVGAIHHEIWRHDQPFPASGIVLICLALLLFTKQDERDKWRY